jgi:RNA polymerase sigma-70 factor (ECF subfamily)
LDSADYEQDRVLVQQAVRSDRAAMQQIVARHQDRIYRLAYRLVGDLETARDITQETFLRALQSLAQLHDGRTLGHWLCQIATNLTRDRWKQRQDWVEFDEQDPDGPHSSADPGHDAEVEEMEERLQAALMALSYPCREAFLLRHVEGMSYQAIGAMLSVPAASVRVRAHRARGMLRALLPEYGPTEGEAR